MAGLLGLIKEYVRINWKNFPDVTTPLGQANLNKMDYMINRVEDVVINFDTTKANQSDLQQTIRTVTYNESTGIFTFTFWNDSVYTVDLNIEKIPVSFSMSPEGVITMVTADGTTYTCDISTLIKIYSFNDSETIDFITTTDPNTGDKTIEARVKNGSITPEKLNPNFLADCIAAKNAAETAALKSEGFAVGEQNGSPVPDTSPYYENNAKYFAQQAFRTAYGTCDTEAATSAKVVTIDDANFALKAGMIIGVKFAYTNTASNLTLNVNNTGNISIWYSSAVYTGNSNNVGGNAGGLIYYMYDGTYWVWLNIGKIPSDADTIPSAICSTKASTSAKVASCSSYSLLNNSYLHVDLTVSNTKAGALTFNVNSTGAKPIYINGAASSSTNYTLPAGTYLVYYDGTNYYFRTDGKLTGAGLVDIAGNTDKFFRGDGTLDTPVDENVKQSIATGNVERRVLLSTDSSDSNRTGGVYKNPGLTFNTSTRALNLNRETTTANDSPEVINLSVTDTDLNSTAVSVISARHHHAASGSTGANLLIKAGGTLFAGSGESTPNLYTLLKGEAAGITGEAAYFTADSSLFLLSNCNTIENRLGIGIDTNGAIKPILSGSYADNAGKIGISTNRFEEGNFVKVNSTKLNNLDVPSDTGTIATVEDLRSVSESKSNDSGQFNTITGGILQSCNVKLDINQDLHGYSEPWVGGSGKNKLPLTVSGIKSANTSGTWSGNTYTLNTEVFKINTDTDGNVTSIDVTHVSSGATLTLPLTLKAGTYHMSSGFSEDNGLNDTYLVRNGTVIARGNTNSPGQVFTLSEETNATWNLRVYNKSFTAYPMICLNSETDKTFEPYTNICGITGHSSVEVWEHGKNYLGDCTRQFNDVWTCNGGTLTGYADGTLVLDSGTYTISLSEIVNGIRVVDESGQQLVSIDNTDNATFTISEKHSIKISYSKTGGSNDILCQLEEGSTATTYEPYQGQDITISLGQTVYGGSVDVVSGVLTIDKVGEELSDLSWSTRNTGTNNKLLSASVSYLFDKTNFDFITEKYKYIEPVGGISQFGPPDDEQIGIYPITTSSSKTIYIVTFVSDTISGKVVYKLAEPLTIQLTPQQIETLIGQNNVSVPLDGQSLDSLTYREVLAWDDVDDTFANKEYNKDYLKSSNLAKINVNNNYACITVVDNNDGTLTISNDGTNSASIAIQIATVHVKAGVSYKLVGCPSGGSGYRLDLRSAPTTIVSDPDYGEGVVYTPEADADLLLCARFTTGTVASSLLFKPMVSLDLDATYTDFEPYIKSNVELDTEKQICKLFYGTCDTAADVAAKVITVSADQNFILTTGCVVYVKFANTNTATDVTLNVNGSGDKSITYGGDSILTGSTATYAGTANYTNQYMYDGTYWKFAGYSYEKDTTYSTMSVAEMNAGTATSARTMRADRLRSTVESWIDAKTGKWLEQTATLSTSADTTYTFTDSDITADSMVEVWCEIDGFDYSSVTVASGSVTVVYPKYTSAVSMKCRINVKNITV